MSRFAFLLALGCANLMAAELPSVSLKSDGWVCTEWATIDGGVARLRGGPKRYTRVAFTAPGSSVAGKRLRFSADVKTADLIPASSVVYASPKLKIANKNGGAIAVNNFGTRHRPHWDRMFVEAVIPKQRTQPVVFELGLQFCSGSLHVRNVRVEEVKPWRWQLLDAGAGEETFSPATATDKVEVTERPNVLFIAVDDLKPELNCYGANHIISPNLDRLAAEGTIFTRAYCQQAVCSPSRTSLLTGLRPDSTQVYDLTTHFRTRLPNVVTLPQHFAQHGYVTMGMGKIYHGGLDDQRSWTTTSPKIGGRAYVSEAVRVEQAERRRLGYRKGLRGSALYNFSAGPPTEKADIADHAYRDGALADAAVKALQELAGKDKPFFLAVGFFKPHLPFNAPQRYWDMYDVEDISLATNPDPPTDVPRMAMHNFGELRAYQAIPQQGALSEAQARHLVHGYYACVSFVDAQIGKLLNQLEGSGLQDNTVVIVWGDHGWHLGDHGLWCKHTNFESATRAPLIVRVPKQQNVGQSCSALVEFVDIYPSLCDLARIPAAPHVEGTSFSPLIADPERDWKRAAFSQYPRGSLMGYSMRTDRYRYTEWIQRGGNIEAIELYDHSEDPLENANLATLPKYASLVARLGQQLRQGWRAACPSHIRDAPLR